VIADRSLRADQDKPALRLRLMRPRIGVGPPARLELRKAEGIPCDRDAVLVHFETVWRIRHRSYFKRNAAPEKPGAERCAVAEVIKQRSAAVLLLVEPTVRLAFRDRLRRSCFLAGDMPERAAVTIIIMNLDHFTDRSFIDQ